MPGFIGKVTENFNWHSHISSYARYIFVTSKNGTKSTLDLAPARYNNSIGNCNFSVMSAYCQEYDFAKSRLTHKIKASLQSVIPVGRKKKNKLYFEMQYSSIPTEKFKDTHFGNFQDGFSFTTTYQMPINR